VVGVEDEKVGRQVVWGAILPVKEYAGRSGNMDFNKPLAKEPWRKLTNRCISCGLLCKRLADHTDVTFEATVEDRNTGTLYTRTPTQQATKIWCFVYEKDLYSEYTIRCESSKNPDYSDVCKTIIMQDIECPKWFPYRPFMSPKEHFERFLMMQLEQERRKFERNIENDRRHFEERLEKDKKDFDLQLFSMSQKIQQDSKAIVERGDKFNRRITAWLIILSILGVVFAFLQLAFPNGIPALIKFFGGTPNG
jgi:hypothetical protein